MEASKATDETTSVGSTKGKGGASKDASPVPPKAAPEKVAPEIEERLRTTDEMNLGSGLYVDKNDYSKVNPMWKADRLKHLKRRSTDYMLTTSAQLKPPHNPKWKKGRLDHITRTPTIAEAAPPKWIIVDKSFDMAGLHLVAWKWQKLSARDYSTAEMFAGGAYGMLTSDVDPTPKKSAASKA